MHPNSKPAQSKCQSAHEFGPPQPWLGTKAYELFKADRHGWRTPLWVYRALGNPRLARIAGHLLWRFDSRESGRKTKFEVEAIHNMLGAGSYDAVEAFEAKDKINSTLQRNAHPLERVFCPTERRSKITACRARCFNACGQRYAVYTTRDLARRLDLDRHTLSDAIVKLNWFREGRIKGTNHLYIWPIGRWIAQAFLLQWPNKVTDQELENGILSEGGPEPVVMCRRLRGRTPDGKWVYRDTKKTYLPGWFESATRFVAMNRVDRYIVDVGHIPAQPYVFISKTVYKACQRHDGRATLLCHILSQLTRNTPKVRHVLGEDVVVMSERELARELGMSQKTVNRGIHWLVEHKFLLGQQYEGRKFMWRLRPDLVGLESNLS